MSQAGNYSVTVPNSLGGVISANAQLVVNTSPSPTLALLSGIPGQFRFSFVPVVGPSNTVKTNTTLDDTWNVFTNFPPPASANTIFVSETMSDDTRNYPVRIDP